jgi:hypothetical protein
LSLFTLITSFKVFKLINKYHRHTNLPVLFPTVDLSENIHGYTIFKGQESPYCRRALNVIPSKSSFNGRSKIILRFVTLGRPATAYP